MSLPRQANSARNPLHTRGQLSPNKSLAPALRPGWLVVPDALRDEVIAARALTDRFTTPIIQAAVAEFIARGDLDRHLRRTRRSFRQRRDALIGALQRHLPGPQATGISAGLHVVVRLPGSMDPARVAATAARHGILVHPLDHYRVGQAEADPPALVMGYSKLTPHQIEEGIQRLASIA
jgi:GntR family transcriptional regulator / MocR family aminotransferase